ncbi:MAG: M20 family metallopeptidase [Chloroflexi bacterium]|nr:M20 family metallopeptidase [Chloroflexota bacterium]MCY4246132.1 M20 family metallopeptidase [Chloroflexota bacterium]
MTDLLAHFRARADAMLDLLGELTRRESFTADKTHGDQLVDYLEDALGSFGAQTVRRLPQSEVADFLLAEWNPTAPGQPVLALCHIDTVHPLGTLQKAPARIDGPRFYAPGALDMKAGAVIALFALQSLHSQKRLARPVKLLLTTDEEIGSPHSRSVIEAEAAEAGLALALEPATPEGALKTARKGCATFTLTIEGRPAHAGIAPQLGINAIIELARQALDINALNNLKYGTSVSVTQVTGGSAGNVIPAQAQAHIDARAITSAEMQRVERALASLYPKMPGAKVRCQRLGFRPPMERQAGIFERAAKIAARHGITLEEGASGGGSDGNFTAALGIPTLDGLGAHGDGAHTLDEHIIIDSLPRQAAVVAAILLDW